MKTRHNVPLASGPINIVRSTACQGGEEERVSETADVDDDGKVSDGRRGSKIAAESPGVVFAKGGELKRLFLKCNPRQVIA